MRVDQIHLLKCGSVTALACNHRNPEVPSRRPSLPANHEWPFIGLSRRVVGLSYLPHQLKILLLCNRHAVRVAKPLIGLSRLITCAHS
uniref:Uncharacterized protein n=1 Tax=Mesocestoides corti TaxID=53468 RepID=A0A5K3G4L9_MESCO